jgi:hypothetical protein
MIDKNQTISGVPSKVLNDMIFRGEYKAYFPNIQEKSIVVCQFTKEQVEKELLLRTLRDI